MNKDLLPPFRHDYRVLAMDGQVYEPVSLPLAQDDGEFLTLA